jgi:hypothetical protein
MTNLSRDERTELGLDVALVCHVKQGGACVERRQDFQVAGERVHATFGLAPGHLVPHALPLLVLELVGLLQPGVEDVSADEVELPRDLGNRTRGN